ncbi:uncharacterized protein LOC18428271 isoform X1 [Amborella trichopoda]|uniref:uncharacterized protein LOC18428271 isoform X1 n=1 Tax=Amborella trichopoda TaxID=13333 RepID=UPI0005D434F1|nr:uncharacterized protein LOC18428271 isoform X1 [Amborella trichopoda]|eukprot:XP_006837370.2 uncharacterized protein LOC18428271 isoform X1 [Amborella trichopoda]
MDRWCGLLRVSLDPKNVSSHFTVGASLCLSSLTNTLSVPSVNAILFNGDRVQCTGNPVIERLSDPQNIASILVSKLGSSVNAWVVGASTFNGPFAIYKEFLNSVNEWGEPPSYKSDGFPASTSIALLMSQCVNEAKKAVARFQRLSPTCKNPPESNDYRAIPKTIIFGFSKGGVVLNQLLTELAISKTEPQLDLKITKMPCAKGSHENPNVSLAKIPDFQKGGVIEIKEENPMPEKMTKMPLTEGACSSMENNGELYPNTRKENPVFAFSPREFMESMVEVHYVDVGLNCRGAYLTEKSVVEKITHLPFAGMRIVLHGTPRQWQDRRRTWIKAEKDMFMKLLRDEEERSEGKLRALERLYFAEKPPNMQMHFEIIECMNLD